MIPETENPWKTFATNIGATYKLSEEGTSLVTGSYKNYPFILKMIFIQAAPKVNLFLTHFKVLMKNKNKLKFKIYREGILQKLTKLFGTQDIIFNDRSFNKKYIIEGSHEEIVKEIISPNIRAKVIELGEILLIFDGETFIYEQAGKIIDSNRLLFILEMLTQIADKVENYNSE